MQNQPSNELPIPDLVRNAKESQEIIRIWIVDDGQVYSIKDDAWSDAAGWGLLLVDIARHIAKARSMHGEDAVRVLRRIKSGFDVEWNSSTDSKV